jgi:uncharacterized membrane protein
VNSGHAPDGPAPASGDQPGGLSGQPGGQPGARPEALEHGGRSMSWSTRLILGFVLVVVLVAGWFIATAFLPRWWAQRVGQVADGSFTAGIFAGLTCGVVFTAGPLLVLRLVVRRHARWVWRLVWLVLAALIAVPNLTTLGIVLGTGSAAHAGERTLDVNAPGFRGASLVGAVIGAIAVIVLWVALFSRRRKGRELQRLRTELRHRDASDAARDAGRDARPDVGHDARPDGGERPPTVN